MGKHFPQSASSFFFHLVFFRRVALCGVSQNFPKAFRNFCILLSRS